MAVGFSTQGRGNKSASMIILVHATRPAHPGRRPVLLELGQVANVPRDNDLLSRVRATLARVRDVEEKKMFGGTMFMVRGKMCVSARAERIMCRIDPALHDAAVKRKG